MNKLIIGIIGSGLPKPIIINQIEESNKKEKLPVINDNINYPKLKIKSKRRKTKWQ